MELKHSFTLIVVFICITHFHSNIASYAVRSVQFIRFFEALGCNSTGLNEEITSSTDNLTSSWLSEAQSLHIQGSWRITMYNCVSNDSCIRLIVHVAAQAPNGTCMAKSVFDSTPDWQSYQIYYANRYGPSDLTDSQLILFSEEDLYGLRLIAANDSMPELFPEPLMIQSYMHFSNQTWITYEWPDFLGRSHCFCPTKKDSEGNLTIWKDDEFFQNTATKIEVALAKLDRTDE